jgi:hypothetical protein
LGLVSLQGTSPFCLRLQEWLTGRQRLIIVIMIAALIYAIMLGTFIFYEQQEDQDKLLRQQTIAKCLDSGGHIGPGVTCWPRTPVTSENRCPE